MYWETNDGVTVKETSAAETGKLAATRLSKAREAFDMVIKEAQISRHEATAELPSSHGRLIGWLGMTDQFCTDVASL